MESRTPTLEPTTQPSVAELKPGAVLRSRYVLEEQIGSGGQCIVFRAVDLHRVTHEDATSGLIALKVLSASHSRDPNAVARLAREFRQMQKLAHPGIARVFDLDCDGDMWFISMELVAGQTVDQWMRECSDLDGAMKVIGACSEALDYAHSHGVVHGDLKPSNVVRTPDGGIKLIDFGSVPSHVADGQSEPSRAASTTPAYASPQLLAGMPADVRDDVFSLACLSYAILSEGERPFGDKTSLEAHRARLCPAVIPGMPVEVFAVLARSLAGDRAHRPASAGEFYRDLLGLGSPPELAKQKSPARHPSPLTLQRLSMASVAAGVLGTAVLLFPLAQKLIAGTSNGGSAPAPVAAAVVAAAPIDTSGAVAGADDRGIEPAMSSGADALADPASTAMHGASESAPAAGVVTFESAALIAGTAQSLVAIPIKRLQSTRGATSVEWRVDSGSALPNVDYQPLKPQRVKFNEGESTRSLFIPLLPAASESEVREPRTFTVQLRAVDGGAKLGAVTRIKVTLVPQPTYAESIPKVALK